MATYVLVCGAWLGGWCWQPIVRHLRDQGHHAYPLTLTGLGERVHLASPEVNLDTHITDVVNLIEFEDLRDVFLLGHSYAGIVVTGAADRIPERIAQLVYLDSGPVADGLPYLEGTQPPEVREHAEREVRTRGDGWRLPMPSWDELQNVYGASLEGLDEPRRALMRSRAVAQPFGTYTQPLRLTNTAQEVLPKLLITNSFPLAQVKELIASEHPWFRELAGPEWRFVELPTGHWAMFSRPDDLAELLIDIPASETPDVE
jgi:pimeloyl-ACP methyl ester carboxylesterase